MFQEIFRVWETFGDFFSSFPDAVVTVSYFVFCAVSIVGIVRAF